MTQQGNHKRCFRIALGYWRSTSNERDVKRGYERRENPLIRNHSNNISSKSSQSPAIHTVLSKWYFIFSSYRINALPRRTSTTKQNVCIFLPELPKCALILERFPARSMFTIRVAKYHLFSTEVSQIPTQRMYCDVRIFCCYCKNPPRFQRRLLRKILVTYP